MRALRDSLGRHLLCHVLLLALGVPGDSEGLLFPVPRKRWKTQPICSGTELGIVFSQGKNEDFPDLCRGSFLAGGWVKGQGSPLWASPNPKVVFGVAGIFHSLPTGMANTSTPNNGGMGTASAPPFPKNAIYELQGGSKALPKTQEEIPGYEVAAPIPNFPLTTCSSFFFLSFNASIWNPSPGVLTLPRASSFPAPFIPDLYTSE